MRIARALYLPPATALGEPVRARGPHRRLTPAGQPWSPPLGRVVANGTTTSFADKPCEFSAAASCTAATGDSQAELLVPNARGHRRTAFRQDLAGFRVAKTLE